MSYIYRVTWIEVWNDALSRRGTRTRTRIYLDETAAARQVDNIETGGNKAVRTTLVKVERAERERFAPIDPDGLRRAEPDEETIGAP